MILVSLHLPFSQFFANHGEIALTAVDNTLNKPCSKLFFTLSQKYDDVDKIDNLSLVSRKVDTVKLVMEENVRMALQNCVKLDDISLRAGEFFMANFNYSRAVKENFLILFWLVALG